VYTFEGLLLGSFNTGRTGFSLHHARGFSWQGAFDVSECDLREPPNDNSGGGCEGEGARKVRGGWGRRVAGLGRGAGRKTMQGGSVPTGERRGEEGRGQDEGRGEAGKVGRSGEEGRGRAGGKVARGRGAHHALGDAAAGERVLGALLAAVELLHDLLQAVARGGLRGQPLRGGVRGRGGDGGWGGWGVGGGGRWVSHCVDEGLGNQEREWGRSSLLRK